MWSKFPLDFKFNSDRDWEPRYVSITDRGAVFMLSKVFIE